MDDYQFIDYVPDKHLPGLIHYLKEETYWTANVSSDEIRVSIEQADSFCIINNDELIGYARVVSDRSRIAYLADVFIKKEHQGKGLSKKLIRIVLNHPNCSSIKKWLLCTDDAQGLYEKFGFKTISEDDYIYMVYSKDPK